MFFYPPTVGVGYKELAIPGIANPFQQLMHPGCIKLFEDIIQKNDGCESLTGFQHIIFSQFHGKEQAFALALRSNILKMLSFQPQLYIILMNDCLGSL